MKYIFHFQVYRVYKHYLFSTCTLSINLFIRKSKINSLKSYDIILLWYIRVVFFRLYFQKENQKWFILCCISASGSDAFCWCICTLSSRRNKMNCWTQCCVQNHVNWGNLNFFDFIFNPVFIQPNRNVLKGRIAKVKRTIHCMVPLSLEKTIITSVGFSQYLHRHRITEPRL